MKKPSFVFLFAVLTISVFGQTTQNKYWVSFRDKANVTFDPYSIEAINEPSWILDLDMSSTKEQSFNIDSLMQKANSFAARLYTFFRWVVNDEFLRRYGGEV